MNDHGRNKMKGPSGKHGKDSMSSQIRKPGVSRGWKLTKEEYDVGNKPWGQVLK